jgi:hypothetical protein
MVSAFSQVPQRLKAKVAGHIFASAPRPVDLDAAVRCLRRIAKGQKRITQPSLFANIMQLSLDERAQTQSLAADLNESLADDAKQNVVPQLLNYWDDKEITLGAEQRGKETELSREEEQEVFLAIHYANLIRQVFTHIQNMMTFLVLMLLCLLFCFDSYPFQPHTTLLRMCFVLVIWTLFFMIVPILRYNRNEVLSLLSNTRPNRLTLDRSLILPLFAYVGVPLISLLIVRFPTLHEMFFGWVNSMQ